MRTYYLIKDNRGVLRVLEVTRKISASTFALVLKLSPYKIFMGVSPKKFETGIVKLRFDTLLKADDLFSNYLKFKPNIEKLPKAMLQKLLLKVIRARPYLYADAVDSVSSTRFRNYLKKLLCDNRHQMYLTIIKERDW